MVFKIQSKGGSNNQEEIEPRAVRPKKKMEKGKEGVWEDKVNFITWRKVLREYKSLVPSSPSEILDF